MLTEQGETHSYELILGKRTALHSAVKVNTIGKPMALDSSTIRYRGECAGLELVACCVLLRSARFEVIKRKKFFEKKHKNIDKLPIMDDNKIMIIIITCSSRLMDYSQPVKKVKGRLLRY